MPTLATTLSRVVKTQQALLIQEYERLGKPLESNSVEELIRGVDLSLSKQQTWLVQDHEGPAKQKQFLSNLKLSVWIPPSMTLLPDICYDDKAVPMVKTTDGKQHYCVDIFQQCYKSTPQASSRVPLPAAPPLPGIPGQQVMPKPAPPSYGSQPLAGMAPSSVLHGFKIRLIGVIYGHVPKDFDKDIVLKIVFTSQDF